METLNSNGLIRLRRIQTLQNRSSSSSKNNQSSFVDISAIKNQRRSRVLSDSLARSNVNTSRKNYVGVVFAWQGNKNVEGSASNPDPSGNFNWLRWLVGVILPLILPFASKKWSRLLAIKNEVDTVVETVETVVETVETVAEEVAHVADEVAHQLPKDGKLHDIVCHVANVAEETAKDAHFVDQLIEKIEDMEKEVESTFVGEVLHDEIATKVVPGDEDVTKGNIQSEKELLEQKHGIAMEVQQDEIVDNQPK